MRTNAVIRIIIYSLVILILLGILISSLFFGLYIANGRVQIDNYEATEAPLVVSNDIVSADIRNIEIEWVAGSITIQPDDTTTGITISEYAPNDPDYQMVYKQSGQTLKIQFCEESMKFPSFGINVDVSKDLVITVPANWSCNKLEIDAAAAEVEIYDLNINEVDFDGASGECLFENCNIVSLDIDTASGNVEFKGILKELDFDAASAKFRGEFLQVPNHLYMDTMSGDLDIILPSYCGFEMEYDSASGSFGSDFEFTTDGTHYKCGDGACKIKINAMSSDINILKGVDVPQTNN